MIENIHWLVPEEDPVEGCNILYNLNIKQNLNDCKNLT